jgi:hypothetical protein
MGREALGVLQYSADGKVSVHIMGEGYFDGHTREIRVAWEREADGLSQRKGR